MLLLLSLSVVSFVRGGKAEAGRARARAPPLEAASLPDGFTVLIRPVSVWIHFAWVDVHLRGRLASGAISGATAQRWWHGSST